MFRLLAIAGLMAAGCAAEKPDAATIVDSGSTNRPGFRIVVDPSGGAEWTSTPRKSGAANERRQDDQAKPIRKSLPSAAVERFYADLKAAKPLGALPAGRCRKSASFGSTLTVAFGGEQTPDLRCGGGGNDAMRNLVRDANEIVNLMQAN